MGERDVLLPAVSSGGVGGIDGGSVEAVGRPSPWRWWTLGLFSYLAALQCMVWFTFSSVPAANGEVRAYLQTSITQACQFQGIFTCSVH